MRKIKVSDRVFILRGKDRGRNGIVSKLLLKNKKLFVLVEGLNLVKKKLKSNPNKNKAGGILNKEAPIIYSNVCIFNDKINKKDKIGFKLLENGKKKVRYLKSNNEVIS